MSTATYLVGDVFERLAELPDATVDLVLTSPPFLALRSYLPADHPDKAKEIGSEPTPAEFLQTLLELTAEWGRVLAPHGSLAVELGDTYAGSGGAGGDYNADGLREGQQRFSGTAAKAARAAVAYRNPAVDGGALRDRAVDEALGVRPARRRLKGQHPGWPLDKSLCLIPELYAVALSYGMNPLTGEASPAGLWRVRTVKPWIRSNPPVGALGDKERPATSYVIVATRERDRYFDLDAVRVPSAYDRPNLAGKGSRPGGTPPGQRPNGSDHTVHPSGAPPRDWWHHVDAVLDACLDEMAGKANGNPRAAVGTSRANDQPNAKRTGNWTTLEVADTPSTIGARGVHLRRALEAAGILITLEAVDVSPSGYSGAHYAVWPKELVRLLVDEMCPRRVCTTCGEPSRRIVSTPEYVGDDGQPVPTDGEWSAGRRTNGDGWTPKRGHTTRSATTLGWSDCGHDSWRRGLVLDPFAGSGTTLSVCTGMARDAVGIDLDARNADLARERVGMFLTVDERKKTPA